MTWNRGAQGALKAVLTALAVTVAVMGVSGPRSVSAALANDNFAGATAITSLPFTDTGDLSGDTTEPGEPQVCTFMSQTAWYTVSSTTVSAGAVTTSLSGSDGSVSLNIWQSSGGGIGSLSFVTCISAFQGAAVIQLTPGSTYYIQVGSNGTGPAHVQLAVQAVPPPPNDDLASPTPVTTLPFTDTVDMTAATLEPGEPASLNGSQIAASIWYSFTPTVSQSVTAGASSCCAFSTLAMYTGNSVAALTKVAPAFAGFQATTFSVTAGTTYDVQVGRGSLPGFSAPTTVSLQVTPPPTAGFWFSPSSPSIFDAVQLSDSSFDPAGAGITSESWSLGDGTSATGCCLSHRYSADGDYTVKLAVTTADGRRASTSQVVHVRTHDVSISKFTVPTSASVGQTRAITVGISDTRYADTVQVQLLKSVTGTFSSFQLVGTLTQSVKAQPSNKTTPFSFNYTFTADDGTAEKVTFETVVTIVGFNDAQPADNIGVALATTVNAK